MDIIRASGCSHRRKSIDRAEAPKRKNKTRFHKVTTNDKAHAISAQQTA
jgi:hypothetical protein